MPERDVNREEVEAQKSCCEHRKESWELFCASLRAS